MRLLLIFAILHFFYTSHSQTVKIIDKENADALELVTISSQSPKAFTITNTYGEADISSFIGSKKIEFRIMGYMTSYLSYAELAESSFIVTLNPGISLGTLVISATRSSRPQRDIPQRVKPIGAAEIALQNPQTTADILQLSGEVFIQKSQQGGGSPMIRGFATNRLLIAVDGIRMNNAIFRSGNLQNVISIDALAIERAEVIFGPGSVMYGSDAIGGVMSFKTLTPRLSVSEKPMLKGSALSRYSSANNEITNHFNINVGWQKWAILSSVSHSNFGDLRMGTHGPDDYLRHFFVRRIDSTDRIIHNPNPLVQNPSAYEQTNIMQKIRYRPNNKLEFNYAFHHSESSSYDRYDRHIRNNSAGMPRSAEWRYGPQKWMMNNINISHNSSFILYDELNIRLAHQYFEESRIDRSFNRNLRRTRLEKVNALSANLDFSKSAGEDGIIYYGIEGVFNEVVSSGQDEDISIASIKTGPSRYPDSDWASWAVYSTYRHELGEKLMFEVGGRYNIVNLNSYFATDFYPLPFTEARLNNSALTGSAGLVYKPHISWLASMNFSTGFRAPNVDDIGKIFDSEPGKVMVPNPDLKPEYAKNIDLSVAKHFRNFLKFDFTAFYTILDNAMVRREYSLSGQDSIMYDGEMSRILALQNAAFANVYGVQAGIELIPGEGFSISSRINYQRGEEELEDGSKSSLRHAAPIFGTTKVSYKTGKLKIELYANYSDEMSYEKLAEEERGKPELYAKDKNGNPWSPAWYTVNFRTMYRFSEAWTLTAGIENITDRRYRPYSSGLTAPGRNFIMAFRANF